MSTNPRRAGLNTSAGRTLPITDLYVHTWMDSWLNEFAIFFSALVLFLVNLLGFYLISLH